jgi:hypothetical protein
MSEKETEAFECTLSQETDDDGCPRGRATASVPGRSIDGGGQVE